MEAPRLRKARAGRYFIGGPAYLGSLSTGWKPGGRAQLEVRDRSPVRVSASDAFRYDAPSSQSSEAMCNGPRLFCRAQHDSCRPTARLTEVFARLAARKM